RQLDEVVALKVLRSEVLKDDPTLLDRFKQEIKLARRITHRNVLRTHDFGEADRTPYISMEYLEGVTLKDLIRSKGALPLPVGLRSDIYSLGVVFYEIFTGRRPFAGDSVMAVVLRHIQQPPPPPRQANPAVPGELEAIILRCLEKDPARRYQRVESVLEDLGAVSTRLDATAA